MEALDKVGAFIENLELKTFYKYLGIILGCILLLAGIIVFRYYRTTTSMQEELKTINEQRKAVQSVLTKLRSVQEQRAAVDRMLDEKEFYFREYFSRITNKLGLKNIKTDFKETSPEDGYAESELHVEFAQMDMKQLTELLRELSDNKRIYTKEIDISKSPKQPKIEVKLTIGTLLKKQKTS